MKACRFQILTETGNLNCLSSRLSTEICQNLVKLVSGARGAVNDITANAYREVQGRTWTQGNPLLCKEKFYYRKRLKIFHSHRESLCYGHAGYREERESICYGMQVTGKKGSPFAMGMQVTG